MVWPPQTPDLNIIESVLDYMKRQKDLRKPISGLHEETEGFEEAYIHRRSVVSSPRCLEQLTSRVPSKTSASVSGRIDAILKSKGGHTKY